MSETDMSTTTVKLTALLSPKQMKEVDAWIAKYPKTQRQSAVMSTLSIVQAEHGFLTEAHMDAVADYLNMAPIAVYEVASFYTMYETKPVGRHIINICTNIACQLSGCAGVVKAMEKKLGIKLGETTPDGCFTLRGVECLAACVDAPAMQVDRADYKKVSPEAIDAILESYS